jgi:dUTPase
VKYDFRTGHRLLKAGYTTPVDTQRLTEAERSQLYLDPGEIAFVLTEEELALPENMVAMLSPKRKLSHEGILVLGGFLIDPLYAGPLIVGLYNFSTTRWPLRPDKKLIAAVFYTLAPQELGEFPKPESFSDFPDGLVQMMQRYQPVVLEALREAIRNTQKDIADLRDEFRSQEEWKRTFRESLDAHDKQIGKMAGIVEELGKRLDQEMSLRSDVQQELQKKVTEVDAELKQLGKKGESRRLWLIAIVSAVLGVGLTLLLQLLLQHLPH